MHHSELSVCRLPGGRALAAHTEQRLRRRLAAGGCDPGLVADARYVHFAAAERPLAADRRARLAALLGAPARGAEPPPAGRAVLVVPRLGTISPWSSKATEIVRNCGLDEILRLERGVEYRLRGPAEPAGAAAALLHDRMTESCLDAAADPAALFARPAPRALERIELGADPEAALAAADRAYGLALSAADRRYLAARYRELGRDPTDAELMMFAQVNSEHCRHKIFNARWIVDGAPAEHSLFDMIRRTHAAAPEGTWSAYADNAAVLEAGFGPRWAVDPADRRWRAAPGEYGLVIKVETHNHPTGISPHPGAATGNGGEIRDEAACGRGARPQAGLCGFAVGDLQFDDWPRPWEEPGRTPPPHLAAPLEIMIDGPLGAASFNNEFGRPCLAGYFRTLHVRAETPAGPREYGYRKPIMLAGGLGSIAAAQVAKRPIPAGTPLVALGGPAMLIGLGGGAASSLHTGARDAGLDYASVQRSNPEMQRRAQEVIEQCAALGADNPILSIHDVGAGGLSNALPELVAAEPGGAELELRDIPSADPGLSPRELWCNEAQERYVLAVRADALPALARLCARERCPHAVLGRASGDGRLRLRDRRDGSEPVDLPLSLLFGEAARRTLEAAPPARGAAPLDTAGMELAEAAERVLSLPAVASKSFLITIGDRTVGGLSARDPMVGPWQVPVADAAVTAGGFEDHAGAAMALGERPLPAVHDPAAAARLAVAEALTNLAGVRVRARGRIRLSANWMAAADEPDEARGLREAVAAAALEFCPRLGVSIPVGKDSLSMRAGAGAAAVRAPVTLVASAFAPVADVRRHVTPELRADPGARLLAVGLSGRMRLGCTALAQVYGRTGADVPDCEEPERLAAFFDQMQALLDEELLLAYHDRSDGGLFACLCECAFAGRVGLALELPGAPEEALAYLFNEEPGAVLQVPGAAAARAAARLRGAGLACDDLGAAVAGGDALEIRCRGETLLTRPLPELLRLWSRTGYEIARRRDHAECAAAEYGQAADWSAPAPLHAAPTFAPRAPMAATGAAPEVAILREQGVNGQAEMAAAFARAGFACRDLHMSDLLAEPGLLDGMRGLAAPGGFSYGDVLDAGGGWANNILFNDKLSDIFEKFFQRPDIFVLGVCNGCQMLARLRGLIPGADGWPRFAPNLSGRFEARLSLVEIVESPSVLLRGMAGSRLPVAVAHGEGRLREADAAALEGRVCLRYVDAAGRPTERYPANPGGSAGGVTGFTSGDGRFTLMMPHPERVFRTAQHSWHPPEWGEDGPWLRLFQNAREWVEGAA